MLIASKFLHRHSHVGIKVANTNQLYTFLSDASNYQANKTVKIIQWLFHGLINHQRCA
jgi:hypothetical protein